MAVLDPLVDVLNDRSALSPWARVIVIAALLSLAWAISRVTATGARHILVWHDRLHREPNERRGDRIAEIKRRETTVAVIRAAIGYVAVGAAVLLSVAQLTGGVDRLTAIAGASFFVILVGFAIQRVLTDIIAGLAMFVEHWYSVGDTIAIPAIDLQGVVEDVSLRRTRLRTLDGEVIHVHNSQIPAVRVLPSGVKEFAIEVFVSDRAATEAAIESVIRLLPGGPTTFIRKPAVELVEELAPELIRFRLHTTVAPGREWLAEGFFADLLREKAAGVIVHGPVALSVDERAVRSFARASASTRWAREAA